ncbi:MAG: nuclear transport factor 2 family protein [Marinoscillum sp.]
MKRLTLIILLSATAILVQAQEATQEHKDSLIHIVNQYYALNEIIFQANSTLNDIDQLFELFTEDFTYVHPKYGGEYSRNDLLEGYMRNQENSGYNGDVTAIKVLQMIVGLNAVATEKQFIHLNSESEPQMTLFEFENGKISRIQEYW